MRDLKARYREWAGSLVTAGAFGEGGKLRDDGGVHMRLFDGEVAFGRGPLGNETPGGFFILDADDYSGVVTHARSCPHLAIGGRVEIREIEA